MYVAAWLPDIQVQSLTGTRPYQTVSIWKGYDIKYPPSFNLDNNKTKKTLIRIINNKRTGIYFDTNNENDTT